MGILQGFFPILMGASTGGEAATGKTGPITVVTFGAVILIFYFLIIRPQNKKQKETKNMLANLKKGDRVSSIGGIRGVVQSVKEDAVIVKIDGETKIEFSKSAIANILEKSEVKED